TPRRSTPSAWTSRRSSTTSSRRWTRCAPRRSASSGGRTGTFSSRSSRRPTAWRTCSTASSTPTTRATTRCWRRASATRCCAATARGLEAEVDPATGERFVARVYQGHEIFPGAPPERMPDLQLAFRDGYRTSWRTPLGGIPKDLLEPNLKKWSGDHAASDVVDTPGVILASRRLAADDPAIVDLAPTALAFFGVPVPAEMEGHALLAATP